jgi:NDP-sugar pyrophosphorylase family protein
MIFAAGLGTRLKPLTDTMPKALVPICGQPLLYHVLTKLITAGYQDIVVNVHHFPEQIRNYLATTPFDARIRISDESDLLRETGGALRFATPLLQDAGEEEGLWEGEGAKRRCRSSERTAEAVSEGLIGREPQGDNRGSAPPSTLSTQSTVFAPVPLGGEGILVHNVDIVSDLDLGWFRGRHREGALATLLVSERKTQRYFLFDDDMRLVGWTNVATGEVRSPWEGIDPEKYRKLAFSGVHLISPAVLALMADWPERFSIVDFYLKVCAEYPIYGAVPEALRMVDVGKMETLPEAERVAETILREK